MPRSRKKAKSGGAANSNPLLEEQRAFLCGFVGSEQERESFFDPDAVSPTRRAKIWAAQAALGERLINQYAWATPNDRAIRILKYFSPIVEVGCGANAYWCRQMQAAGVDCLGYDAAPDRGGLVPQQDGEEEDMMKHNHKQLRTIFRVRKGGPDALTRHSDRTLFLCYPDEEQTHIETQEESKADLTMASSMAAECLKHYNGDYVIHVGELLATGACLAQNNQAPWGRSSSPDFQERLATEFHCVLCIELPNWLHTRDRLTVWKRSKTTTIVFAAEDEDDDSDEEVEYRHIPVEERLPVNLAAPYLQHLVAAITDDIDEKAAKNVETKGDTAAPAVVDTKAKLQWKKPRRSTQEDSEIVATCSRAESTLAYAGEKSHSNYSDHNKSGVQPKRKKRKKTRSGARVADGSKETEYSCPW